MTLHVTRALAFCFVADLLFRAPALHAQSLADLARQEQARRQQVTPGKSYTNKDLKKEPPLTVVPSSADAITSVDVPPVDRANVDTDTEEMWRTRMTRLREQHERDTVIAEALESRINALTTDAVNRDDPAERRVLEAARTRALVELDRTRILVDEGVKAIESLEEEARRAGVPAGWLR
jgi:hypothetical protein